MTKHIYIQNNNVMRNDFKDNIRKDCFQVRSNLLTDFQFTTHMNIMILN
jgi:hypothetical protein